jgi:hypothetical protein
MAVRKLSVALEERVASAAQRAADRAGLSLSGWLNQAAENKLGLEAGLAGVRAWEMEHGAISAEELAKADRILDRALGPRKRRGGRLGQRAGR